MKNVFLFIVSLGFSFSVTAQELFRLRLDSFQHIEHQNGSNGSIVKFPHSDLTVVMGGLNDWDGMNNYINLFGSKLIIDSSEGITNGIQHIVLRREDGRDFFELFPTLRAKLIPLHHSENKNDIRENITIKYSD